VIVRSGRVNVEESTRRVRRDARSGVGEDEEQLARLFSVEGNEAK
jgi:hypothetical protein